MGAQLFSPVRRSQGARRISKIPADMVEVKSNGKLRPPMRCRVSEKAALTLPINSARSYVGSVTRARIRWAIPCLDMGMSESVAEMRKCQNGGEELGVAIRATQVHKRRRAKMKWKTPTRHTKNLTHLDIWPVVAM